MAEIRLIEVKEDILADNQARANQLRERLRGQGVFLLNLMSSPGSGKTSLILRTIAALAGRVRIGVIEGDIASVVDAQRVSDAGVQVVQLRTGGLCHLDAGMIELGLAELDLARLDCVIIENVGNLVCPAEFDTGAVRNAMILSVPEGDDKPLKYPLMFSVCDALVINKTDYLGGSDFDMAAFRERVRALNPRISIFPLSCKTGEGLPAWHEWLERQVRAWQGKGERR